MSFHKGLLPREGFHADVLGGLLKRTALNPFLTLPVVLAAAYTAKGRELAARHLGPRALSALKVLGWLGAIRVVNGFLSRRAVNNGVRDAYRWDKEVVLLTGGSDGIGRATALMLASHGVKVAVLDIQPLTYTPPPNVKFFHCDITSTESLKATAEEVRASVGAPTVLVNNAGVCRGKALLDNTDRDLEVTFGVNAVAHYKLAREFLPGMVAADHGMVVTVASTASYVTAPRMTEYAASKAAAMAFHEGLAAELVATYRAPRVRTVLVSQGYTRTSLFRGFGVRERQFVAPSLHVDTVAQAIAEQILSGESGHVVLPGAYKLMGLHFRSLPDWIAYPARAGLGHLMQAWDGRQVPTGAE